MNEKPEDKETRLGAAHRRFGYLVVSLAIVIVLLLGALDPDRGPVFGPISPMAAFEIAHGRLHVMYYMASILLAALGMAIFRPLHRALLFRHAKWILSDHRLAGYKYRDISWIALIISLAPIIAIIAAGVWLKETFGWAPWTN